MLITSTPLGVGLISEPSSIPYVTVPWCFYPRLSEVPWAIICYPMGLLSGSRGNPTPQGTTWPWEHHQSCL